MVKKVKGKKVAWKLQLHATGKKHMEDKKHMDMLILPKVRQSLRKLANSRSSSSLDFCFQFGFRLI